MFGINSLRPERLKPCVLEMSSLDTVVHFFVLLVQVSTPPVCGQATSVWSGQRRWSQFSLVSPGEPELNRSLPTFFTVA